MKMASALSELFVSLCAAVWLCGCSSSDSAAPAAAGPPTVGAAGGTVTGPSGSQVTIPAGALAAATAIAIAQSSSGAPALPAGATTFGDMFAFTPHGTSFAGAVTVTVPFNPGAVPAGRAPLLYKTNAQGAWEAVPSATIGATSVTGQVTSFSWMVCANVPPLITQHPQGVSVVEPDSATFGVAATGAVPLAYQWQRSNDGGITYLDIPGATSTSYTTAATSRAADDNARFRVIVSNAEGASTSNAATLTVTGVVVAPTITTHPQHATVTIGASATFTVVAAGTAPTYQWQRSNDGGATFADVAGATSASFTLVNAQPADSNARFRVRVANSAGSVVSNSATLVVQPAPVAAGRRLAGGNHFSFARTNNGAVFSWGSDSGEALGNANAGSRNAPGPLSLTVAFSAIATAPGAVHGLAIEAASSRVLGWGYNMFGQLGDGSGLNRSTPVPMTRLDSTGNVVMVTNAIGVAAGSLHSLVLLADGTVLATGANGNGQLGDGTTNARQVATLVPEVCGLDPMSGLPLRATAIAAGGRFSLALCEDRSVRAWGANGEGQLGDGSFVDRTRPATVPGLTNVTGIAAGNEFALVRDATLTAWSWGSNSSGQLAEDPGGVARRAVPARVAGLTSVAAVTAGSEHALAVRVTEQVVAWGRNAEGQLGLGNETNRFVPTLVPGVSTIIEAAAGSGHSMAVDASGMVWTWGRNADGELGLGTSTTANVTTPQAVPGLRLN